MIREAITKIEELCKAAMPAQQVEIEGRIYHDKPLMECKSPLDSTAAVGTLTGFSDLIDAALNSANPADQYIHIIDPTCLIYAQRGCDVWGRRQVDIQAELPDYGRFQFGQYMDQEAFHIGLQVFFDQSPEDMAYLYRIAGNLTAEQVTLGIDDGISQSVGTRVGMVLAEKSPVRRVVTLQPWRTFREIAQPPSRFIFRLKSQEGKLPLLGLFCADGEQWQLQAMQSIKTWLTAQHPAVKIVA